MTPLAQGGVGLALVMEFGLLATGQVATASILLTVQSAAVALTAVIADLPLTALPPLILSSGVWLIRHRIPMLDRQSAPAGGTKVCIAAGAALTILCGSQGSLALPSAIVLLSILLAASRTHPLMRIIALVAMQNGIALAGCLVPPPELQPVGMLYPVLLPLACVALPLTAATGLISMAIRAGRAAPTVGMPSLAARLVFWQRLPHRATAAFGWVDLLLAIAIFAATLLTPLDALASVFAPLLGLDGVLRSCARMHRGTLTALRRGSALAQAGFTVLVVCTPNPILAWLALIAGAAAALLPMLSWRPHLTVTAFPAMGLGLFGLALLPSAPTLVAYFSLFAGVIAVAAEIPDLGAALVILLLRMANRAPWPPEAAALGPGLAAAAVVACAISLLGSAALPGSTSVQRTNLLQLGQLSVAALAICLGSPDGRFAAMVLLILLLLTRAATRLAEGRVGTLAMAGLGGVPPFGVFPADVLVVLAMSEHEPWLLPPLLGAVLVIWQASLRRTPRLPVRGRLRSVALLPLMLAIAAGYFAPEGLVHWCRVLTAAPP